VKRRMSIVRRPDLSRIVAGCGEMVLMFLGHQASKTTLWERKFTDSGDPR